MGNRLLVRLAAQIFQHRFGMAKRPLGVDYPSFLEELIEQFLVGFDTRLECFDILGSEDFTHPFDWKQILPLRFGSLPVLAFSQSASRHDAVQMRVETERLSPSVQNGDHSRLGAQMFGIFGKAVNRLPDSFK